MKPLAISGGDPAGIAVPLLLNHLGALAPAVVFAPKRLRPPALPAGVAWEDIEGEMVEVGVPSRESGRQALAAFHAAAAAVPSGRCSALVTLPLSKIHASLMEPGFRGHTEELGRLWGGDPLMVLEGGGLRMALITTHLRLSEVPRALTQERVVAKGRILRDAIKRLITLGREPALHLLALNPHAGEEGLLGDEEERILKPALEILHREGGHWKGPHPADGFFAQGDFGDAVLAPYHDQGLVAVKLLAKRCGVNITLGLKHVRTSPDHGTAFDLARTGAKPDPSSFLAAVKRARELQRG